MSSIDSIFADMQAEESAARATYKKTSYCPDTLSAKLNKMSKPAKANPTVPMPAVISSTTSSSSSTSEASTAASSSSTALVAQEGKAGGADDSDSEDDIEGDGSVDLEYVFAFTFLQQPHTLPVTSIPSHRTRQRHTRCLASNPWPPYPPPPPARVLSRSNAYHVP